MSFWNFIRNLALFQFLKDLFRGESTQSDMPGNPADISGINNPACPDRHGAFNASTLKSADSANYASNVCTHSSRSSQDSLLHDYYDLDPDEAIDDIYDDVDRENYLDNDNEDYYDRDSYDIDDDRGCYGTGYDRDYGYDSYDRDYGYDGYDGYDDDPDY